LQAPWHFDLIQDGYTLKAIERGGASSFTFTDSVLGASSDGSQSPMISMSREMDSVLPAKVLVRYLDSAREYDVSEQYAERLNTEATSVVTFDAPLVMTADEAAQAAESLLYRAWAERHSIQIDLPPSYGAMQPSDVVTINVHGQSIRARVEDIEYKNTGVLSAKLRSDRAEAYSSSAIGQSGASSATVVNAATGAYGRYLDIPCLTDKTNQPGYLAAIWPYVANDSSWKGATIFKSQNQVDWQAHATLSTPGSTAGFSIEALPNGRYDIIDASNVLKVRSFTGAVSSVTADQLFAGQNWFAVGADQRWEIIGAQTVEQQVDGTWYLSDLLRGRLGTEWAASTHQVGDAVVLLDANKLVWLDDDLNQLGSESTFKTVSSGASIESVSRVSTFSWLGENLKPISPVYVNGSRHPTTRDWSLSWIRRTRIGWQWRNGADAALGEIYQGYVVNVYTNSSFSEVKRSWTVTTTSTTYSSANQVADFGSNQGTLYLGIYQTSNSSVNGRPVLVTLTRG